MKSSTAGKRSLHLLFDAVFFAVLSLVFYMFPLLAEVTSDGGVIPFSQLNVIFGGSLVETMGGVTYGFSFKANVYAMTIFYLICFAILSYVLGLSSKRNYLVSFVLFALSLLIGIFYRLWLSLTSKSIPEVGVVFTWAFWMFIVCLIGALICSLAAYLVLRREAEKA